jgi:outer membrane beta-barrel protein
MASALAGVALACLAVPALADESAPPASRVANEGAAWDEAGWARAIQHRAWDRTDRHSLSVLVGLGVGDDLYWLFPTGLRYQYAFTATLAIEVEGAYVFAVPSSRMKGFADEDLKRHSPDTMQMQWYTVVDAAWYPIHGKLALLGSGIGHFDLGIRAGIGAMGSLVQDYRQAPSPREHHVDPCGVFGISAMAYLSSYLSLRIDLSLFAMDTPGDNLIVPFMIAMGLEVFPVPLGGDE